MKCLLCYEWVKLPRNNLPVGKGIMGHWAKLASRVAYRKGTAKYCGYENEVNAGMWAGGVVGLKSIIGIKKRAKTLATMDELVRLGLVSYTIDDKTKKLELTLPDWVHNCDGSECMSNLVYVTEGYSFLCIPRNITERLAEQNYAFEEADAWLDLGRAGAIAGIAVALAAVFCYDTNTVVLSVLGTYFGGIIVDHFIFGLNIKQRVCVISPKLDEITDFVLHELHSGATLNEITVAYDKTEKKEIITIVDKHEYRRLMDFVKKVDPKAFVNVYAVNEIWYQTKI